MFLKTNRYQLFDNLEIKESIFREFELPNHFHDTFCFGLMSSGIKNSVVEKKSQIIHSNSISVINPYQIHSDKNIDTNNCHLKMIYVNKDVVKYFSNNSKILFTNDLITNPKISNAILSFFNDLEKENLLENKLKYLIENLISEGYVNENIIIKNEYKNAIDENVEHLKLNFSEKIDLDKMSNESKISKFQFIRHFKKKTGLTPAAYILNLRINCAIKLLMKDVPIGQIALEVGFYDHAQFCKFFKYYTNISPSDYKRNCNIIQA